MDRHRNRYAVDGVTRCECGSKYWEGDRCIDCGGRPELINEDRKLVRAVRGGASYWNDATGRWERV